MFHYSHCRFLHLPMAGISALFISALYFLADGVFAQSVISAELTRNSQYDGYMGGSADFKQHRSRSRIDCARQCTRWNDCMSNMFDASTMQCHLFNSTVFITTRLTPTPGAICHSKFTACSVPFQCPPLDTDYHTFEAGNGRCIQIRYVTETRNHHEAIADCEATGGRLMVIDNAEKKDLVNNLTGCFDGYLELIVDGSNTNAADYTEVHAYTTKYGEVITVNNLLWNQESGVWIDYNPTTEHCLMYHYGHHHTHGCETATDGYKYFCQKENSA